MAENKTKQTQASVLDFIDTIPDPQKRQDSFDILGMMQKVTGMEPKMWGHAIIGFGSVHYKYESGREGDMPLIAFSPRKQNLTLYLMGGFEQHAGLLAKLGKHSLGKGCLYIKRLSAVDRSILEQLMARMTNALLRQKHITGQNP